MSLGAECLAVRISKHDMAVGNAIPALNDFVLIEPAEGVQATAAVQPSETDRAYFCDYRISEAPGVREI